MGTIKDGIPEQGFPVSQSLVVGMLEGEVERSPMGKTKRQAKGTSTEQLCEDWFRVCVCVCVCCMDLSECADLCISVHGCRDQSRTVDIFLYSNVLFP